MPEPSPDVGEPSFERRIVSVLFADLVGFTSLSERLDPEDVATIQDAYFTTVRETVTRHGGQLEKFIGDAAMAVFGVPRARDDDAERAIRAGLALVSAVETLGPRLGLEEGETGLRLRVGVNSGEVVSAESGPDAGRVTGDTVNLAARLQTAAEPGTVLVGQLTSLAAADAVELEPLGELTLKGKAEPIPAWRVIGLRPERSRETALGALRAPLLGRDAELAELDNALRVTADEASARQLLIVAPPGVGKSRLLLEFAARAEAAGALVLRARVRPDGIGPADSVGQLLLAALAGSGVAAQQAAHTVIRDALQTRTTDARAQVVADEVSATLWPTAGTAAAADVAQERDARFNAWLEALDALAGNQPSVWLVEDVHWAGGDLLAFLARAGDEASRTGRLVVATARPSVLEQSPQATSVLELPPLPALDSAELVTALIGTALPKELVGAVAERSDGNPLFIEELLRSWISGGTLVPAADRDGGWQLAVAPGKVPLPATVQAIYAAQLDDLPSPARVVARRASVAGRRFPTGALIPLEIPDPDEGLAQLRRRAFLRGPEIDMVGDEVYAYRHALLRDAGYASLSRADRGRLHVALADWLEQTAGDDAGRVAEPIASHYEAALAAHPAVGADPRARAALTDAARRWLERAADAALGVAAHEAAVGLLARATALAPPDSLDATRLRLRRGELLAATGDMDLGIGEMKAVVEVARTLLRAAATEEDRFRARAVYGAAVVALGDAMIEQIRFIQARELVTDALVEMGPPEDALVGRLLALRAYANIQQGDRGGTVAEVEHAWSLARGADARIELEVLDRRASVRSENDLLDRQDWRDVEERARSLGQWAVVVRALRMRAGTSTDDVSEQEILALLEQDVQLAIAHGLTEQSAFAKALLVNELMHLGDWDRALETGYGGITDGERSAYVRAVFRTWISMAPILTARGEAAPMERYAEWFDRNRSAFPDPPSAYGQVLEAATNVRMTMLGLPPISNRTITPQIVATEAYSNSDYLEAVETVIGAWIRHGNVVMAEEASASVTATYLKEVTWPTRHREWASMLLHASWAERARGKWDFARRHAREALEHARTAEAPWWVVRAIRALPEGDASPGELAEADEIERRLRVRPGAAAPPV